MKDSRKRLLLHLTETLTIVQFFQNTQISQRCKRKDSERFEFNVSHFEYSTFETSKFWEN